MHIEWLGRSTSSTAQLCPGQVAILPTRVAFVAASNQVAGVIAAAFHTWHHVVKRQVAVASSWRKYQAAVDAIEVVPVVDGHALSAADPITGPTAACAPGRAGHQTVALAAAMAAATGAMASGFRLRGLRNTQVTQTLNSMGTSKSAPHWLQHSWLDTLPTLPLGGMVNPAARQRAL